MIIFVALIDQPEEKLMEKYDILIIGSGPGGYVAAIRAAQLGMRTGVVEKAEVGGVCLNWGCIPTKALLKSAQVFQYFKHATDYGIKVEGEVLPDFPAIIARSRSVAEGMSKGIQFLFRKNKIDTIVGTGRLAAQGVVEVTHEGNTTKYEASHIILATGSRSKELPNLKQDGKKIIGVDEDGTLLMWEGETTVSEVPPGEKPPEELPPEQVVPPSVVITSPEEGAVIQGDTVTVEWTVEPGSLSVVKTEISLDGGVWIDVTGETTYTFTGLSEGGHTTTVRAVDEAGNVGEDSVGFTVEFPSPPPSTPIQKLRTVITVILVASVVIIAVLAFLSKRT